MSRKWKDKKRLSFFELSTIILLQWCLFKFIARESFVLDRNRNFVKLIVVYKDVKRKHPRSVTWEKIN